MIYLCFIALSVVCAFRAEKRNSKYYLFAAIVLLSLLSGLRDISVGTDTKNYFRIFNNIANGGYSSLEPGFVYLSRFLLKIFQNPRALFIIYAFLTNLLLIGRLWTMREYSSFGAMFFLYVAIFFPESMNIIRQYLALAIVFYATKFIEQRKYWLFLLWNLIAVTIHTSSAVGILILLIWLLTIDKGARNRKILVSLSILAASPFILFGISWMYENYIKYTQQANIKLSLLIIGRILCLCFFVFIRIAKGNPYAKNEQPANYTKYISCVYAMGILLTTAGFLYDYVSRIALYLLLFEIPFAARVSLKEKNRVLMLCYIVLALYFLIVKTFIMKQVQIIPYRFFTLV